MEKRFDNVVHSWVWWREVWLVASSRKRCPARLRRSTKRGGNGKRRPRRENGLRPCACPRAIPIAEAT